jgi:hypothetical protein
MKSLLRLLAVAALLTAHLASAADAFEGKVSLAVTADRGPALLMDYSLKGKKVRIDLTAEGRAMASILDLAKLEMLMLMPDQAMYMVMPIKQPLEQAMDKSGASPADIQFTGKTETILGYPCSQVIVQDGGTTTELWVAEGLGTFTGLGGGGPLGGSPFGGGKKSAGPAKWEQALKDKAGFPLRVISRDTGGRQTFKMEATKITPGALADSLFSAPAGYQKFALPGSW